MIILKVSCAFQDSCQETFCSPWPLLCCVLLHTNGSWCRNPITAEYRVLLPVAHMNNGNPVQSPSCSCQAPVQKKSKQRGRLTLSALITHSVIIDTGTQSITTDHSMQWYIRPLTICFLACPTFEVMQTMDVRPRMRPVALMDDLWVNNRTLVRLIWPSFRIIQMQKLHGIICRQNCFQKPLTPYLLGWDAYINYKHPIH